MYFSPHVVKNYNFILDSLNIRGCERRKVRGARFDGLEVSIHN
jgi:hypothetical protein